MKRHPNMHKPVWTTVEGKRIKVQHHGTIRADGRANYFVTEPYDHRGSKFLGCHWLLPVEVSRSKNMRGGLKNKTPKKHTRFPGYRIEIKKASVDVIVKPCPFCGPLEDINKPYMQKDGSSDPMEEGPCWIQCYKCEAQGPNEDSQEEAVKSWNKRVR